MGLYLQVKGKMLYTHFELSVLQPNIKKGKVISVAL